MKDQSSGKNVHLLKKFLDHYLTQWFKKKKIDVIKLWNVNSGIKLYHPTYKVCHGWYITLPFKYVIIDLLFDL